MSGQSEMIQQQDTLNRYLLYFPRSKGVIPDVHSFTGTERLSSPYRYTIRFTSPDQNIAIDAVLNQMAEFILRAPNPNAAWQGQLKKRNATLSALSRQAQCDPHAEMSEENREWIDAPAVVSKASSLACPLSFPSPVAETLPLQPVLPSPWTARGQKQRA